MILRLTAPGEIKVTCPPRLARQHLFTFVDSRKDWIEKQNTSLMAQDHWRNRCARPGESYLFLGDEYKLRDGMTFLKKVVVEFDQSAEQKTLWIHWPEHLYAAKDSEEGRLLAWKSLRLRMRTEAEKVLTDRTRIYAQQMELRPSELSFRSQKARWGSCSSNGKISLNRRLLGAPVPVIDAVVVHELSHMVHMNHSKNFWALVARFAPEHKAADLWLGQNAHRLLAV